MKISKKSQYGLRAMVFLAKNYKRKRVSSLKEISQKEEMPFSFLEKIIASLEKAGFLKSKKGARGGYFLAKAPSKITVSQILECLEGKVVLVDCSLCERAGGCSAERVWKKIKNSINSTLSSLTLKDLIK